MKVACLSFSERGKILGEKLKALSTDEKDYKIHHYYNGDVKGGLKSIMGELFKEYHGLIFISATGIAIRLIHSYIIDKTIDPAVVVIDDMGRFSISLLSGHIGGANELAKWAANIIGAIPVITTASDNRGIEAIDTFAIRNNYYMENMKDVKNLTSLMVNGKKIGFYSEMEAIIQYDNLIIIKDLEDIDPSIEGIIIVSSQTKIPMDYNICHLIPKNINIGIGCRKGVGGDRIIQAIKDALYKANISINSIKALGTVEVKKGEKGIIEASKYFNLPLEIFTLDEIRKVEDKFEKSQFVKDTIGVYSVSEPSAYLLGGNLITKKSKHNGITISIAKEEKNG